MPEWTPPQPPKYRCWVHEETDMTYQITMRNKEGEIVFRHIYCLQCYDLFLQQHLDLLTEVKEEDQENNPI